MRGASPRGDDPRGAYRVLGDQVRAQVIESITAADLCGAIATSAGHAIGHTDASDVAAYPGPLRGAINITAALRGGVWLTPSPGPKGGRPH